MIPQVAASERGRAQTGMRAFRGSDCHQGSARDRRTVLEGPAAEGESPVSEVPSSQAGSRVPRDTGNPVGMSGDHSVRLNTTQ